MLEGCARTSVFPYRESNPRRLGESQTCYLLHHIGRQQRPEKSEFSARIERTTFREPNRKKQVLAGDRTLGLPRVKRAICQLSYENEGRDVGRI